MNLRRYFRYWDWLGLLLAMVVLFALNERAEQRFDMVTKYNPLWVFQVSFFGPLVATVYFTWKYRLFDRSKFIGSLPVLFFLVSIVWLYDALPRFVLLATVASSAGAASAVLQDLDVDYVKRHYAKTTYIGSNIGIRYNGEVLQFQSSRTRYFLLMGERCIRAEIGQAAPGFYYIRNLQRQPGAQAQADTAFWWFWLKHELPFLGPIAAIWVITWLLKLSVRKHRETHP